MEGTIVYWKGERGYPTVLPLATYIYGQKTNILCGNVRECDYTSPTAEKETHKGRTSKKRKDVQGKRAKIHSKSCSEEQYQLDRFCYKLNLSYLVGWRSWVPS